MDKILDQPETTGRTTIKFATLRMREHGSTYRVQDFASYAHKMPHAADSVAALLKTCFTIDSLEDWFLQYCASEWAAFEWSIAQQSLEARGGQARP